MKTRLALMTAVLILAGDMALARVTPEALASEWTAMGYQAIEITQGRTQTKIEAIRGGQKVEVIYDTASGRVLKREEEQAEAGDDIRPGVWLRSRNRDFVRLVSGGGSGDDDGSDDSDDDDDHGGNDDDHDDDHGGHGSDDDHDDDHGGDHHGGSDDGDDDHGSGQGRGRGRGRGGD